MVLVLIFLLLLMAVVVGLVFGVVFWSTGGARAGSGEMSCGSCGYAVKGLTQLSCPECGADLREVGISKSGSAGRRTLGMSLTIICGGLLLLGCGCSGLAFFGFQKSATLPAVQSVPVQSQPVQPSTTPSPTPGAPASRPAAGDDQEAP